MIDDSQKARPHKIDGKTVETKRAMPKEVCFVAGRTDISVSDTSSQPFMATTLVILCHPAHCFVGP